MAKLDFDLVAVEVATLLNHGKRDEARAMVLRHLEAGTARAATQKLAAQIFAAKKGRQRTGPYKWFEIGQENYWLEIEGVAHAGRISQLAEKYGRSDKHIEACISLYNKGLADGRE